MRYAEFYDITARSSRSFTEEEKKICETLLEDAAVIVDTYNANASLEAKLVVCCNMVIRAMDAADTSLPVGASQGTISALGYSQSWTMTGGGTGELYLTKIEKKMLGVGSRLKFVSPFGEEGQ